MLTLVSTENDTVIKESRADLSKGRSNVVSIKSKTRTKEKSQQNVLRAAKKLKW
ncbi:hypothetical protein ACED66_22085 [Vibrio splendidus]|uniref:hypothetical protein n=1 Tax=Vibrio splendidus TaxID=29497 RepID=UPI0015E71FFD|nr:hypothetical protein [Vibrio splendidus]